MASTAACASSTSTLDLWLLHQPVPSHPDRTIGTWQTAELLLAEGRVRVIGVSNFSVELLERLVDATDVDQPSTRPNSTPTSSSPSYARPTTGSAAWSPIGGGNRCFLGGDAVGDPMSYEVVIELAERHVKTPAQVLLRWQLRLGHCAIPRSVRPQRITENADIFDFELEAAEMAAIEALDTGVRGGPDTASITPETFGLDLEP